MSADQNLVSVISSIFESSRWRIVPIADVVESAQAGFACGERDSHGCVQIRMNNVDTKGNLVWDEITRVPLKATDLEKYVLIPEDVLFNNTNSTELVGKSALFRGYAEPVVYSNHFTRLRVRRDIVDPSFVSSWLLLLWTERVFEQLCNRWIGQSAVKGGTLLGLKMPLPPLSDQKRITTVLTEELANIEKAKAAISNQLTGARALPAAYLRDVFESGEAQKLPRRRLGEILTLRKEVIHPRDNPKGPAVFVGLEHIASRTGIRTGAIEVEMSHLTGRKPRFRSGDIVYGYLRPYLNKVWIADFDGLCSVDQYVFEVNREIADTGYVAWFMRSDLYLGRAPVETTPGQLPRIRTEEVAAVEIQLPQLAAQIGIARDLTHKLDMAISLVGLFESKMKALQQLSNSILRLAFSGGL